MSTSNGGVMNGGVGGGGGGVAAPMKWWFPVFPVFRFISWSAYASNKRVEK